MTDRVMMSHDTRWSTSYLRDPNVMKTPVPTQPPTVLQGSKTGGDRHHGNQKDDLQDQIRTRSKLYPGRQKKPPHYIDGGFMLEPTLYGPTGYRYAVQ